ncbi:MAG TPA: hypothetical protein VLD86_08985, partial [Ilumatobacteraceae bacterium]|nr:hypothetical protein [Ilumatobacteraceae bacterium]
MTTVVGLTHHTLSTLVEWDSPLVVSAFVPLDFSRPQPTETITQALRRLGQMATSTLTDRYGLAQGAADMLVSPLFDPGILDGVPTASRGFAVFVSSDHSCQLALPIAVGPAVEVGHRPDILRLLPVVVEDADYFALTIGKKGAKLFRGSQFCFEEVPVPDMPGPIEDALWYIRREPVRNRVGSGVLHGSGGGEDLRKDNLRQYIHLIDKALTPVLGAYERPLVVIGVEYEASMFINHTHYRHTVDVPVAGSPEAMSADDLHRRSWAYVQARASGAAHAVAKFRQLAGTGKAIVDGEELVTASRDGLVSDLLLARSATDDSTGSPLPAAQRS